MGCPLLLARRVKTTLALLILLPVLGGAVAARALTSAPIAAAQEHEDELEELLAAERAEADLSRRRGRLREALERLNEHLEDEPEDHESRLLRARCRLDQARYEDALRDARAALEGADGDLRRAAARLLADVLLTLGRSREALGVLEADGLDLAPDRDARDAWTLGRALEATGDDGAAFEVFERGVVSPDSAPWEALLARARCEWAVGRLQRASRTIVAADRAAQRVAGFEPDILTALGELYFESEREIEATGKRSAAELFREARRLNSSHEGALLGLFELHRYNRQRQSERPEEILADLLGSRPDSIAGLLARASAALEDGQLPRTREDLEALRALAPGRREVRSLGAALAWVEHRREECEEVLAELARVAPGDSLPERTVGEHLIELYRFAEAVPFLERATRRRPSDWEAWTLYARGLANTGREEDALEAFEKAEVAARGRRDAWRENTKLVLERMQREHVVEDHGALSFSWRPDAAEVLRAYLVPFYEDAREQFSSRYGFTPSPTRIEVFRRHGDFSVRSVGFEGFPALGVCFGPVVTSLSPLSELRGKFSWARTSYHEFSHVVHLGLSHNRCPRWITEGLATWEEVERNPTWTRNMRRELVDSHANRDLIRVRDLNRAFRGPRILFGYYQGGLLCRMLIDEHGFPPMIRLLEAFDRGLDLDLSLAEVFHTTPEQLDLDFEAWVAREIAPLAIEPRWSSRTVRRLQLQLRRARPQTSEERAAWAEDCVTVAWGSWQAGRRVDAEQALRKLKEAGLDPPRARFLRGEMAVSDGDRTTATEEWGAAVEAGGRDYRALVGLASLVQAAGDEEEAERLFLLAQQAFPGYDQKDFSAELRLVGLYLSRGDLDQAMEARERWLAWNAGEYGMRRLVADWHMEAGRSANAARLFREANEVDPFRRSLHVAWGTVLAELGRWDEAEREFGVALIVPVELDGDGVGELSSEERAELMAQQARCLVELGRLEEAKARLDEALRLDPECELAQDLAQELAQER